MKTFYSICHEILEKEWNAKLNKKNISSFLDSTRKMCLGKIVLRATTMGSGVQTSCIYWYSYAKSSKKWVILSKVGNGVCYIQSSKSASYIC